MDVSKVQSPQTPISEVESLGNFSLLPNESILHILSFLKPQELPPLNMVNHTWIYIVNHRWKKNVSAQEILKLLELVGRIKSVVDPDMIYQLEEFEKNLEKRCLFKKKSLFPAVLIQKREELIDILKRLSSKELIRIGLSLQELDFPKGFKKLIDIAQITSELYKIHETNDENLKVIELDENFLKLPDPLKFTFVDIVKDFVYLGEFSRASKVIERISDQDQKFDATLHFIYGLLEFDKLDEALKATESLPEAKASEAILLIISNLTSRLLHKVALQIADKLSDKPDNKIKSQVLEKIVQSLVYSEKKEEANAIAQIIPDEEIKKAAIKFIDETDTSDLF